MGDYKVIVSVCEVCEKKTETSETKIRLKRLADIKNGEEIVRFVQDDKRLSMFSNRNQLRYYDGPNVVGTIGVWEYKYTTDNKDPQKDWHTTKFLPSIQPIMACFLRSCNSYSQILSTLKNGVEMPKAERILFLIPVDQGKYKGLYCEKNQTVRILNTTKLDETVVSLPIYDIQRNDIIDLGNGIGLYKNLLLEKADKKFLVKPPLDIVNTIVKSKLSWNTYKTVGKTRAEFKTVKLFLDSLDTTSIIDEIAIACYCSKKDATNYWADYMKCADKYINGSSIEDEVLTTAIYGNDQLFSKCVSIVEQNWKKENEPLIKSKEAEKKKLLDEIERIKLEQEELKDTLKTLNEEISSKEKLSKELGQEIAKQINDAKENAAKFIAQMAILNATEGEKTQVNVDTEQADLYVASAALDSDDMYIDEDWRDSLDTIASELSNAGVREEYSRPFAAYLYSAELNHIPVILAGPNSSDIANAYSAARYGRIPARFECFGDYNPSYVKKLQSIEEPIISLSNAFSNNWIRQIPEIVGNRNYQSLIVHPFVEDLQIEPEGFFNIALPIFTDILVDKRPGISYRGGKQGTDFSEYALQKESKQILPNSICSSFHIVSLVKSNMMRVLTDAANMVEKDQSDIAVLFALLPYSRANGMISPLLDLIENSDDKIKISKDLRTDILNFFGRQ